jgi:acylphosphatase
VLGIARGFDVTGSIQNLMDGRVYLHAEGAEKELDAFEAEIIKSLDGHIRNVEERSFAGLRITSTFTIKR